MYGVFHIDHIHFYNQFKTHLPSFRVYVSGNWVSIGSGNGLSPVRRQAITRTNADLLSIRTIGTNFSGIKIKIQIFSFMKMHLKTSFAKWRPLYPGGMELNISQFSSFTRTRDHLITCLMVISIIVFCVMPLWFKTKKFFKLLWHSYLEFCSWWWWFELCYRLIQEYYPKIVFVYKIWPIYMIQQYSGALTHHW